MKKNREVPNWKEMSNEEREVFCIRERTKGTYYKNMAVMVGLTEKNAPTIYKHVKKYCPYLIPKFFNSSDYHFFLTFILKRLDDIEDDIITGQHISGDNATRKIRRRRALRTPVISADMAAVRKEMKEKLKSLGIASIKKEE